MSADGVKKFIAAVDLIFPAPQFDGDKTRQAAWQKLMAANLGGADDTVLAETAAMILRTRNPKKDGRFFPTPQECLEACQEVAETLERQRTPLLAGPKEVPYEARCGLARDIMQSPLGQKAKTEGWDTSMFQFCVEHMRAPNGNEIEDCKRTSRAFKADYERLLKPGEHPFGNPLAKLAEGMVRNAKKLMGEKMA